MPILIILGIIIFIFMCIISLVFCIVSVRKGCGTESYDYLGMTAADLQKIKEEIQDKEREEEYKACKHWLYKTVKENKYEPFRLKYIENVQKLQNEGFYVDNNGLEWIVWPKWNEDCIIIASFGYEDVPRKALEEFLNKYTNLIIEERPIEGRLLVKKRIYK